MSEQAMPPVSHETNTDAKIIHFPIMREQEVSPQQPESALLRSTLSDEEITERVGKLRYPELSSIDELEDEARHILEVVIKDLGLDIQTEKMIEAEHVWMTALQTATEREVKQFGEFGEFMSDMLDTARSKAGNSDLLRMIDQVRKRMNNNHKTAAIYAHRTALLLINMELNS